MDRKLLLNLIIGILLIGLSTVLVLWYINKDSVDWKEMYGDSIDKPYDTYIAANLLKHKYGNEKFETVRGDLEEYIAVNNHNANYLLIGNTFSFNEKEWAHLRRFVERGNTLFFAVKSVPKQFFEIFGKGTCLENIHPQFSEYLSHDEVRCSLLYHEFGNKHYPAYQFYTRGRKSNFYIWSCLERGILCDAETLTFPLGTVMDSVYNFISIKYGKGNILLHSTPIAFSNLYLSKDAYLSYVENVFGYLDDGLIYWDVSHKIQVPLANKENPPARNYSKSPLVYVLSQKPLALAWYTLLLSALIFIFFRSKRKQRVIPYIAHRVDETGAFLGMIAKLYLKRGNPKNVALHQLRYLETALREDYYFNKVDWSSDFLHKLQVKSGVHIDLILKIATMRNNILSSQKITANTLRTFHQLLEEFNRQKQ